MTCPVGGHVEGHDSDWFAGLCPCNDFPCKRAVAAQKKYEAEEKIRMAAWQMYMRFHASYPQGRFMDVVVSGKAKAIKRAYVEHHGTQPVVGFVEALVAVVKDPPPYRAACMNNDCGNCTRCIVNRPGRL